MKENRDPFQIGIDLSLIFLCSIFTGDGSLNTEDSDLFTRYVEENVCIFVGSFWYEYMVTKHLFYQHICGIFCWTGCYCSYIAAHSNNLNFLIWWQQIVAGPPCKVVCAARGEDLQCGSKVSQTPLLPPLVQTTAILVLWPRRVWAFVRL